ncbi:ABC-three component system middle component 4 [Kordiimonas sp.]|uniref:ABC-three component system middle component 4 n=1 Tax=Alphaproteobacteria TaxID=28211 RepID=UPI003A8F7FBC
MMQLPYIEPSEELSLNLGALAIIIHELAYTKRGKKVLNFERLQVFYYLTLRPEMMNQVLTGLSKPTLKLRPEEYYTASTTGVNLDPLHDRKRLKLLLQLLAHKKLMDTTYDKKEGFVFEPNETGQRFSLGLNQPYFNDVRRIAAQLTHLQSTSLSSLNKQINTILRGEN